MKNLFCVILFCYHKVVKYLGSKGNKTDDILPGEVNIKKMYFLIKLDVGNGNGWKKSIKRTYPNCIVGAQAKNNVVQVDIFICSHPVDFLLIAQGASGRGVKHVVFWKPGQDQNAKATAKVNLIIYENEMLQVLNLYYN